MTLFGQNKSSSSSDSAPVFEDVETVTFEGPDNLASTPEPPEDILDPKARARYEMYRITAANARRFYDVDRTLDHHDRENLYKAYRLQMFSQYGGAVVGLVAGVMAPKYICRFIGTKYKPFYSSLSGFFSIFLGYNLAQRIAYNLDLRKYQNNDRYLTILKSTKGFPPVIGYAYFLETMRRPDSTMPDPSRIDWTRYPPFPLVLTTVNWYRGDIKGIWGSETPWTYNGPNQDSSSHPNNYGIAAGVEHSPDNRPVDANFGFDPNVDKSHSGEARTWEEIRNQKGDRKPKWQSQQVQFPHPDSSDAQLKSENQQNNKGDTNSKNNNNSKPYEQRETLDLFKDSHPNQKK